MPDNPALSGWSAYSCADEDGIIRECLRRISINVPLSYTFFEAGCADGLANNTHLLLLDGYRGIWIDSDKKKIFEMTGALGQAVFEKLWITDAIIASGSANLLGQRAKRFLGEESIDFLSFDLDGNDWHILPTLLEQLSPKLVCVKYNAKFPPPTRLVMRYNENLSSAYNDYFGASLQSWVDQLIPRGYTLVCCSLFGVHAFFVRNDLLNSFTLYSPESLYQPHRCALPEHSQTYAPTLCWAKQVLENIEVDQARFVPARQGAITIDFAIHIGVDQFISGDIARDGIWEPFETQVFSRLCKPKDIVLDLGANIGWYSVLAAGLVGDAGRVLAFEPDERNARLLEMNAAISDAHGVIDIYRRAVGERESEALFYRSETNLGDHRLFSDGSSRQTSSVSVTTLDVFFSLVHTRLPDIVKSDTQGSEAKIFMGAQKLFASGWRPVMILEFWPFGLTQSGDDPLTFWEQLVCLGYKTFEVFENNPQLVPISVDRISRRLETDISPSSGGFINLLCIPENSDRLALVSDLVNQGVHSHTNSNE
ncbi:hypothetical protein GCM10010970_26380 [Silvimonas iriomotensis]|uniref:Methyltransferase FkbM domain-containing protein n=2 Tax=Silvimonas iriomotensis TaxID=449662 RepID=A0ABQ2PB87_9NEIS|nr:hypothetical protein GCM10010970_26380 [Silvimonas iriomotensis]